MLKRKIFLLCYIVIHHAQKEEEIFLTSLNVLVLPIITILGDQEDCMVRCRGKRSYLKIIEVWDEKSMLEWRLRFFWLWCEKFYIRMVSVASPCYMLKLYTHCLHMNSFGLWNVFCSLCSSSQFVQLLVEFCCGPFDVFVIND